MEDMKHACVFVIPQDYGHFGYTVHLASALYKRGYAIEYWSHKSAQLQCPKFASFHWLCDTQDFTQFYCTESSHGDDDLENINRMSSNINDLLKKYFPNKSPLDNISGNPDRIEALKYRLLQNDVVMCINDKCHLFAWAGEHCENHKVPTLNLCPSQHEIQREHAGVLDQWKSIFKNLTFPAASSSRTIYSSVRAEDLEIPTSGALYVTYFPLVPNVKLLPPKARVIGPVYMEGDAYKREKVLLKEAGIQEWLDSDSRPVIYVSFGSMIRDFSGSDVNNIICLEGIKSLFRALVKTLSKWRVLTTIPREFLSKIDGSESIFVSSWLPQFAVLGHPSVHVFVSHCGANSIHEAIYHAVPIVAVPFFDDQRYNGPKLVSLGLASACLSKENMTQDEASNAINEAMSNPKYQDLMVRASADAKSANALGTLVEVAEQLIQFSIQHPPNVFKG